MDSIKASLRAIGPRRAGILAVAGLGAFLAVLGLARLATAPGMELLFARLDAAVAGEVVASLEARGVRHEVRGDAIYVPASERDALRLQLAGEGLPRADGAGYELLDGLSGFGTTSRMFDAAYWRAREGELTRTILAGPGIKAARVHVAVADASPFARERRATASVTVQMRSGRVGDELARAVQSLVSGAVPQLTREDVTVIDAGSGRVVSVDAAARGQAAIGDRVAETRAAVENLLAARVGDGRYVVELAIETREDRETITERVLDPASRVVLSTDTEERSSSERGIAAGVTVASNLPDGDAAGGEGEASDQETRERVNYDFSATERRVERVPGSVERITVAVLVDGLREVAADGSTTWAPRPEAELETLRALVQSAVGYREDRGDVVTVHAMELTPPPEVAVAQGASLPWLSGGQATRLGTAALLAMVAIAILALVVRPGLRALAAPAPRAADAPALASPADPAPALPPITAGAGAEPEIPLAMQTAIPDLSDLGTLAEPAGEPFEPPVADAPDDPVQRLRHLISERREETVEVLRGWMEQAPEPPR